MSNPCDEFEGRPLLQKKCREDPAYRDAIDRGWRPTKTSDHKKPEAERGPGTYLKEYFQQWGFYSYPGCGCAGFAKKMNKWGPDECERRLESEIVPWVVQQFEKRRSSKEAKAATGRMARLAVIVVSPEEVPELARIAVMDAIRQFRREASPSQDCHNGPLTPDVR